MYFLSGCGSIEYICELYITKHIHNSPTTHVPFDVGDGMNEVNVCVSRKQGVYRAKPSRW